MLWLTAYVMTIFAANWTVAAFGLIPVGFGLMAPAGVLWAGAALSLRDGLQERLGKRWTLLAILVGAGLSAVVSPQFALASGAAFLLSEAADFAVYTPIRRRHVIGAVAVSNVVGAVVDSALFLWLAFGSLEFLAGQLVGKTWVTLATVLLLGLWRGGREWYALSGRCSVDR